MNPQQHGTMISAPADHVWQVFTDVERRPTWTPSVVRATVVDGRSLEAGTAVRIKQPRMPALLWVVTEFTVGSSWTWVARSPGIVTSATHVVEGIDAVTSRISQRIDHRGVLAAVIGPLTASRTRRYLEQEAAGLKSHCEQTWSDGAASA
jgi:uncharacterized protein YndB with AHSA1/START domain